MGAFFSKKCKGTGKHKIHYTQEHKTQFNRIDGDHGSSVEAGGATVSGVQSQPRNLNSACTYFRNLRLDGLWQSRSQRHSKLHCAGIPPGKAAEKCTASGQRHL